MNKNSLNLIGDLTVNFLQRSKIDVAYPDLIDFVAEIWNKALEVAADNADADYNILDNADPVTGENIEVFVIKSSILEHKV